MDLARKLKEIGDRANSFNILKGKTLLLLFFRASTRTRTSFTTAMHNLAGFVQIPNPDGLRLRLEEKPGAGESIKFVVREEAHRRLTRRRAEECLGFGDGHA